MTNIVISTIHEGGRRGDLKLELTTDGADVLSKGGGLSDLFGPTRKVGVFWLRGNSQEIYTEHKARYEDKPYDIYIYHNKNEDWKKWLENPKDPIYFTPDKGNEEREKELIAKTSADAWAVYSAQKLCDAILETNSRYSILKGMNESLYASMRLLNYDGFQKQDDKYGQSIQDIIDEVEKEMDYCHQKSRLMAMVSKNDFNLEKPVSLLYREFRNVDEEKNKEKFNLEVQEGGNDDISEHKAVAEPKKERPEENNEAPKQNDNPEGENHLRVV